MGESRKVLAGLFLLENLEDLKGEIKYLGRMVIVELYDNGALLKVSVNALVGRRQLLTMVVSSATLVAISGIIRPWYFSFNDQPALLDRKGTSVKAASMR